MKALTLHQPWASLIEFGAKSIETRSWSTKYRGPLAIHAGADPTKMYCRTRNGGFGMSKAALLLDDVTGGMVSLRTFPLLGYAGRNGYRKAPVPYLGVSRLPLGAVIVICELVDVLPITDTPHMSSSQGPDPDDEPEPHVRPTGHGGHLWVYDGESAWAADDQRPYGDYRPGRFAWMLANIMPLDEPIPAKGHQGLWNWDGQP